MLKNNSDCYIEGQCEDYVWLKHMTFAMRVTRSNTPARALGNTGLKSKKISNDQQLIQSDPFLGPFCRVKKSPSSRRIGPLGSIPAVFGRDICLIVRIPVTRQLIRSCLIRTEQTKTIPERGNAKMAQLRTAPQRWLLHRGLRPCAPEHFGFLHKKPERFHIQIIM